jgi:hypothetical protein
VLMRNYYSGVLRGRSDIGNLPGQSFLENEHALETESVPQHFNGDGSIVSVYSFICYLEDPSSEFFANHDEAP